MIYYLVTSSKFEQIHKTIKMHYLSQTLFPDENKPKTQLEKFLILLIISSVILVVLETESLLYARFKAVFDNLELILTVIFTLEYFARLALLKEYKGKTGFKARLSYAVSPLAICDLIAIIPYYLMFLSGDLLLLRIFRLFRMLRISKSLLSEMFNKNYSGVAKTMINAGWVGEDTKEVELEVVIRTVLDPIFEKPFDEIKFGEMLLYLFDATRTVSYTHLTLPTKRIV